MTKKKTPPKNKRSTDTLADFEKALDALVQKANAAAKVPSAEEDGVPLSGNTTFEVKEMSPAGLTGLEEHEIPVDVMFHSLYGDPAPAEVVAACTQELRDPYTWHRVVAGRMSPAMVMEILASVAHRTNFETFVVSFDTRAGTMKVGWTDTLTLATKCDII